MTDPYRDYRKAMCFRIADDLRAAALQADEWGHELRERAFANWMVAHPLTGLEVAGCIADIGDRKEFWR